MNGERPIIEVIGQKSEGFNAFRWKDACYTSAELQKKPQIEEFHLINEMEERIIQDLNDPTSRQGSKLRQTISSIAEAARVNILTFVGHTDFCFNYFDSLKQRFQEGTLRIPNRLPTIVFVIGCFSLKAGIERYQKENLRFFQENKFYFFGFEDYVHVFDGNIFQCKETQVGMPEMRCDYPGADENLKSINRSNNVLTNANSNPLKKCCKVKYGRFVKYFLEELDHRNCVRVSPEKLAKRFALVHTRNINKMPGHFFLLGKGIGLECTPETPCIKPSADLVENEKESVKYNEKRFIFSKWEEIAKAMKRNESEAIDLLKSLKKDEYPVIDFVNPNFKRATLLDFAFSLKKYEVSYYLLTQKTYPIDLTRIRMGKFLGEDSYTGYVYQLLNQYDSLYLVPLERNDEYEKFEDWQVYNLLSLIHQKNPEAFFVLSGNKHERFIASSFVHSLSKEAPPFFLFFASYYQGRIDWSKQLYPGLTETLHGIVRIEYAHEIDLLYFISMGLDPNNFGGIFDLSVRNAITELYYFDEPEIFENIRMLYLFGYRDVSYLPYIIKRLRELNAMGTEPFKNTMEYRWLLEKRDSIRYELSRGDKRFESIYKKIQKFLEDPMEYLKQKRQALLNLNKILITDDLNQLERERYEHLKYFNEFVQEQLVEKGFEANLQTRQVLLPRLGEMEKFLRSRKAEAIPYDTRQGTSAKLIAIAKSANIPEQKRLQEMIQVFTQLVDDYSIDHSTIRDYDKLTTLPLVTIPKVTVINRSKNTNNTNNNNVAGGKRTVQKKTRKQRK